MPKGHKGFVKGHTIGHRVKKGDPALPGAGRKKKLPQLDVLLANILGEKKDGITAAEVILMAYRKLAVKGDIKAGELLFNRAYGKPKEFIEQVNKNQIDISNLSDDELLVLSKILGNGDSKGKDISDE